MGKSLADFRRDNSTFLQLGDGESCEVEYLGFNVVPNSKDPTKEVVSYRLKQAGGKIVFWQTASGKVSKFMEKVTEGSKIKITRHGTLTSTTWDIEPLPANA